MAEKRMARSLREIANALENGVVGPSILREVNIFIKRFPMAEVLTCPPEDKLTKCPPEILEAIFQYLNPKALKSAVLVNKKLCAVGSREF